MIGGEEGSAGGKGDGAAAEAGDGEGYDGVGVGKFGDVDELLDPGFCEGVKKAGTQKGLETAFDGHPDGLRLKECLECA